MMRKEFCKTMRNLKRHLERAIIETDGKPEQEMFLEMLAIVLKAIYEYCKDIEEEKGGD